MSETPDTTTPRGRIEEAAEESDRFRLEGAGEEAVPHVCVTVDYRTLPYDNINLTEPGTDFTKAVAREGWAIIRSERMCGLKRSHRRRLWFGDSTKLEGPSDG